MKSLLFALCLVLLAAVSSPANADLAKPKPPEKPARHLLRTSLEIVPDPKAYDAKLQITETDWKAFRTQYAGAPGDNSNIAASIAQSPTRTIIAGLLMFLSVSIAGVLFARSRSFGRTQKVVAGAILLIAVIGTAAIVTRGNAGYPPSYHWRNLPQALADGKGTVGGLDIEIVPDGSITNAGMRLVVPLKKQNRPGEE